MSHQCFAFPPEQEESTEMKISLSAHVTQVMGSVDMSKDRKLKYVHQVKYRRCPDKYRPLHEVLMV